MSKRVMAGVAVGITLVLGGGIYAFAQYQAKQTMEAIRTQVTTHIKGSKLTNGEVNANIFEGSMTVRDLVFHIPGTNNTVTIAEMLLDGNEDELAAAVFQDIGAKVGEDEKAGGIDRVIVSNLALKRLQVPADLSSEAIRDFVANLTIGRFVVENADFDYDGAVIALGKLRVDGVTKGFADNVSYSDASIGVTTDGQKDVISVKSFMAEQVDLASFDFTDLKDGKLPLEKAIAQAVKRPKFGPVSIDRLNFDMKENKLSLGQLLSTGGGGGVLKKLAIKDVEFQGKESKEHQKFSIANIEMEGVDLSSLSVSGADIQNVEPTRLLKEFWRTAKIGRFLVEDFQSAGEEASMAFGKYQMSDLTGGIAGNITVSDSVVSGIDNEDLQSVSIKTIKFANLDMLIAEKSQPELMVALQNFMGIDEGVISGLQVNLKDGTTISVEKFGVEGIERHDEFVTSVQMVIRDVEFPISAVEGQNPEAAAFLRGFSEDVFNVSFDTTVKYDIATGSIVQDMGLSAIGMGKLKLDVALAGFDLETYKMFSLGQFAGVDWLNREDLKFVGLTIRYSDEKLADWLIDDYSNGNRVGLAEHLAASVESFSADRMFIQHASEEIKRFITGANRFLITAKPSSPVTAGAIMQAMQEGAISNVLNLQLSGQ